MPNGRARRCTPRALTAYSIAKVTKATAGRVIAASFFTSKTGEPCCGWGAWGAGGGVFGLTMPAGDDDAVSETRGDGSAADDIDTVASKINANRVGASSGQSKLSDLSGRLAAESLPFIRAGRCDIRNGAK